MSILDKTWQTGARGMHWVVPTKYGRWCSKVQAYGTIWLGIPAPGFWLWFLVSGSDGVVISTSCVTFYLMMTLELSLLLWNEDHCSLFSIMLNKPSYLSSWERMVLRQQSHGWALFCLQYNYPTFYCWICINTHICSYTYSCTIFTVSKYPRKTLCTLTLLSLRLIVERLLIAGWTNHWSQWWGHTKIGPWMISVTLLYMYMCVPILLHFRQRFTVVFLSRCHSRNLRECFRKQF